MCKKSFSTKSSLTLHKLTHRSVKPHECTDCGSKFKQKVHLDNHIKHVHKKERSYYCTVCTKSFAVKQGLEKNKLTHNKVKV